MTDITNLKAIPATGVALPENISLNKNNSVQDKTTPTAYAVQAPSSTVNLSGISKFTAVSGQTSIQYATDVNSGKSVINVISNDDNSVIRKIVIPIPMTLNSHQIDSVPQQLLAIKK